MSMDELYEAAEVEDAIADPETAHLSISKDKVASKRSLPGLNIETEGIEDGIEVFLTLEEGTKIENPVHMCFGVVEEEALQKIVLHIYIEPEAEINILAHCIFPNADDVKHHMDADIHVGKNAKYTYLEKHIHSPEGGIEVVPKAQIELEEGAIFKTDFELLEGRVGELDIDYETTCKENSQLEMMSKVNGRGADHIKINETGHLVGEDARGVLKSRVAVRNEAEAEVYNKMTASAPHARGHVDCKEIIQDDGSASAIPIVEVSDPKAHVTHEAAIGSVDSKQLQTLMSRGMSEDEAVELIINGLLS